MGHCKCLLHFLLFLLLNNQVINGSSCVPSSGETLLIIGQDTQSIAEYSNAFQVPGGTMSYISLQNLTGLANPSRYGSGEEFAQGLINTYPKTALNLGLWLVGMLDEIPKGVYDSNLKTLADWLKSVDVPIYLRIGYEFDNPGNLYAPNSYRPAFQHIVKKLREHKVENTLYVWHSWGQSPWDTLGISAWWPGSKYVDAVGVSIFEQPLWNQWLDLEKVAKFSKDKKKPLMICESTPMGGIKAGDETWDRWFEPVLTYINTHEVKVFSYINTDWEAFPMWQGDGFGDSRVQAYPAVKEKWISEIVNASRYLEQASDFVAFCAKDLNMNKNFKDSAAGQNIKTSLEDGSDATGFVLLLFGLLSISSAVYVLLRSRSIRNQKGKGDRVLLLGSLERRMQSGNWSTLSFPQKEAITHHAQKEVSFEGMIDEKYKYESI